MDLGTEQKLISNLHMFKWLISCWPN